MHKKIQNKIEMREYVAEAQGLFDGCDNDCITYTSQTYTTPNKDGNQPVGGSAISVCIECEYPCETTLTDAGWPYW